MSRWKKKTSGNLKQELLPGQMSVFDIDYEVVPIKASEVIHEHVKDTTKVSRQMSLLQEKTFKEFMEKGIVSRAIKFAKSVVVETEENHGFNVYWIDEQGKVDSKFKGRAQVLPWNTILYYSDKFKNNPFTNIQKQHFDDFISKNDAAKIERVIHRKGDLNILIEHSGKVSDILPNGWILEFTNIKSVNCSEDEIMDMPSHSDEKLDVKVGDFVEAFYGKNTIKGTITREYGLGNEILNINFDNHGVASCTAIGRSHVLKILKSV